MTRLGPDLVPATVAGVPSSALGMRSGSRVATARQDVNDNDMQRAIPLSSPRGRNETDSGRCVVALGAAALAAASRYAMATSRCFVAAAGVADLTLDDRVDVIVTTPQWITRSLL